MASCTMAATAANRTAAASTRLALLRWGSWSRRWLNNAAAAAKATMIGMPNDVASRAVDV